jgi:hypothetical protein
MPLSDVKVGAVLIQLEIAVAAAQSANRPRMDVFL